ncbi:hypothetical protein GWI33_016492 [Rhynchophorus ferrugineus]|uniref:peptidylprolyl isomerase n=1 Tax=Rhynchophorus ferrugineus TaxID=354439 RepID=A0A834I3F9_RHYFE|nr:hypothetical protein GWI33_016492 [Rhynchophorus ferrugineus]
MRLISDTYNKTDLSLDGSGSLVIETIKEGSGTFPVSGSKVKIHYTGTFEDGTKFDSSYDRKQPLVFTLAQGTVIKGLEMGVSNMKKGGRAVLTCFPQYAYGESGYPPKIPPNSTLKFDVELLDWIGEDLSPNEDGGIEKVEVLQPGHGYLTPKDGSQVDIHIRGEFEGRVFEDRDVSFIIGEGSEENIIEGVERSLVKLRSKECVRLKIKPNGVCRNS